MIGQYLSNKNENATVAKSKIFPELNKALVLGCYLVVYCLFARPHYSDITPLKRSIHNSPSRTINNASHKPVRLSKKSWLKNTVHWYIVRLKYCWLIEKVQLSNMSVTQQYFSFIINQRTVLSIIAFLPREVLLSLYVHHPTFSVSF